MNHTKEDLKELQSKSLEEKVQISLARIIEWHEHWDGKVYISNSGGVDSTVLSHLVHSIYPDVPDVYCDTGLEYPELRDFIMSKPNVVVLKPKMNFVEVIKKYGYPIISKEVAFVISQARKGNNWGLHKINGKKTNGQDDAYGKAMMKWKFLLDADFNVDNYCCKEMKKKLAHKYEKESGLKAFVGTMTDESLLRKTEWLKHGCNAFDGNRPISTPLSFWTKSDVLHYIVKYNIPYVKEIYGDIIEKDGVYTTTKQKRTGCIFCGFGCHLEKEPNKFQTLANINPHLYDYCMRGGKYNESGMWIPDKGLGMAKVLDYINVKWWNDGDEAKRDEYRAKYKEKEEIEQSRTKPPQED